MSAIQWTDETWNPVTGCTRVSAGCDHCYAVAQSERTASLARGRGDEQTLRKYQGLTVLNGHGDRHFNGEVRTHDNELTKPLRWKNPRRVFVNSMSDLFHRDVPFDFIDRVFAVMALCPHHTFQVLTKRPERMAEYLNTANRERRWYLATSTRHIKYKSLGDRRHWMRDGKSGPLIPPPILTNVWLGTSVEDQATADARVPHLLCCPAAVRFLSCEPLLGPVELSSYLPAPLFTCQSCGTDEVELDRNDRTACCGAHADPQGSTEGVDWIIAGGESSQPRKPARPCDVAWLRSLVEQGRAAGVPVFVKQFGSHAIYDDGDRGADLQWPEDITIRADTATGFGRPMLNHPKGGDPAEWPEVLRVRDYPAPHEEPVHVG